MSDNPWNLSPAECRAMRALCEHGCYKLAARALDRSARTLEAQVGTAAKKMPQRIAVARLIAFDRWDRQRASVGA